LAISLSYIPPLDQPSLRGGQWSRTLALRRRRGHRRNCHAACASTRSSGQSLHTISCCCCCWAASPWPPSTSPSLSAVALCSGSANALSGAGRRPSACDAAPPPGSSNHQHHLVTRANASLACFSIPKSTSRNEVPDATIHVPGEATLRTLRPSGSR
jgi:hypothetical protein